MRKIQLSLIFVFFFSMLFASQIDIQRAENVAKNIYFERVNLNKTVDYKEINLTHVYTETKEGYNLYYIFNVNNNDGFVIVSADDIVLPRIAYSYEKSYGLENISPEHKFYMQHYKDEIYNAIIKNVRPSDEVTAEWQSYEFATKSINEIQSVQPLLLTTWGQSFPYNSECPENTEGQAIVGCVAVTFAQLMKYYNYPAQGTGSESYYASGYGNQYANFGNTQYHFENIPYDASGENEYLGTLMYHCGVAVNMNYGPDGSGSQTEYIVYGLENYFKYSTDATYIYRYNYTPTGWLNKLKEQVDNGWPMGYSGCSDDGCHAWNCDGYEGDEVHMNWGWNGYYNGFYAVSNLNPGGDSYSSDGAVINVHPSYSYPEGCSSKEIIGNQGAFNDGSGNQNYSNNLDCTYHLLPECGTYVTIDFERFMLGAGDHVMVYDGASTSADLLEDYDNTVANPGNVSSTTDEGLLIRFVTDGSGTAEGWYLSYFSQKCKASTTVTEQSGTVEDGSKSCDYNNSKLCKWYVEPYNAASVSLNFTEFDLGGDYDYLKIYKGHSTSSSNLVVDLRSGDNPGTYNIDEGKATVRFSTSSGDVGAGWKFNYSSISLDAVELNNFVDNVKVYPNPFTTDANIEFNTNTSSNVNIYILNVLGAKIGEINNLYTNGTHTIKVSDIVPNIDSGIYFVKFNSNELEKTIKIVVSK